jgi:hypothetical protein
MLITSNEVERLRKGLSADYTDAQLSLGALFEVACWKRATESNHVPALAMLESSLDPSTRRTLEYTLERLSASAAPSVKLWTSPKVEVFGIPGSPVAVSRPMQLCLERFARSLQDSGFGGRLAPALAAAFGEMVDNAVDHGGVQSAVVGVAGFQVADKWFSYGVADTGQGVLESLKQNPNWSALRNSSEALEWAVRRGASRRRGGMEGTGFSQVLKSIASLSGHLRFRSGDGVLTLDDANGELRAARSFVGPMRGLQLCVTCNLTADNPQFRAISHPDS